MDADAALFQQSARAFQVLSESDLGFRRDLKSDSSWMLDKEASIHAKTLFE
jgi:hypothetical protein